MSENPQVDPAVTKIAASLAGAAVSLRFIQGSAWERVAMFVGAAAASYLGSGWVSMQLHMRDAEGLVGLLLGLYSMPIVAKGYESITLVNTSAIAAKVAARLERWFGV